ncbi:MAG: hypothetical protein KGY99_07520 [Phycisphaerae bacterium]|nr:hypothetical protein [Phycisphaerae bacterium]
MGQPDENARYDASADALRSLAENRGDTERSDGPPGEGDATAQTSPRDPTDALSAMADGEDVGVPPAPPDEPDASPSVDEPAEPLAGFPARRESAAQRQARNETVRSKATKAHAHQYRRFMIPLLLVVGIMLFILGVIVAITGGASGGVGTTIAVVVSFPVSAILVFGAWYFHREVTRAEQTRS